MGPGRLILLDTHTWWWLMNQPDLVSRAAAEAIQSSPRERVHIAAISLWELAVLFHKQRIVLTTSPEEWMNRALLETGFRLAPLSPAIALGAYQLPGEFHSDPADRLIVATARHLSATLITRDEKIRAYPHVRSLWD